MPRQVDPHPPGEPELPDDEPLDDELPPGGPSVPPEELLLPGPIVFPLT
jgi:hypothetical protein